MLPFKRLSLLPVLSLLAATFPLHAEVKLPAIFGDHMVLQEGTKLPVWGTADPGEKVSVTLGKESAKATADAEGKWRAELAALPTDADPITMTVAGKTNTVKFTDVLVGEVWVCSGQSNMEFNLGGNTYGFGGANDGAVVLQHVDDSQLRLFLVTKVAGLDPLSDVTGKWELCTTASGGPFCAVGYFFGHELRQSLKRPVGMIGTSWGGTPAQAWTSLSGLEKPGTLQHYVNAYNKLKIDFPQATIDFPAKQAAYKVAVEAWAKTPEGSDFFEKERARRVEAKKDVAAATPAPPKPRPPKGMPVPPITPLGNGKAPTVLFNGMIAPLIPYAIKGAIWYQGESNAAKATEYGTLFPNMIADWRSKWGEGDFSFLFVQLANFKASEIQNWPYLRESQAKALALPKTGMATAIDIGVPDNIHPQDKSDVGHRLALAARHVAYGEKLVYSGPIYAAMKTETPSISVSFTQTGSGLCIGKTPWVPPGYQPLPADKLVGFTIAGADKNWVQADAKIVGNAVVVSSPQVPNPVAVRYDWANNAQGNLYNKEKLPASSFRTDNWEDPIAQGLVEAPRPTAAK